ncbi:MAG: hypothetical protein KAG66_16955, partial [Methylococcales bacterium]|nr:hypothetical protein [Methylococcales bacterium]
GDKLSVRLNGTSDWNWEGIIRAFPFVQFYDYSKVHSRFFGGYMRSKPANYDLTWSTSNYSNASRKWTVRMLEAGQRVAVPINTKMAKGDTPFDLEGAHDFDKHDLRFDEPKGIVGTLTAKDTSQHQRDALENSNRPSFFYTSKAFAGLMATVRARLPQA